VIVLDTSALVALLCREPGHEVVASHWAEACISVVNLSETLARMAREGVEPRALKQHLDDLGLGIIDFDPAQAVIAGEIREHARSHGVGLADCCCLALALHMARPVLTADRPWLRLGLGVQVTLIR
jgi:PIN domain nuclease of toxin-antitoxin system